MGRGRWFLSPRNVWLSSSFFKCDICIKSPFVSFQFLKIHDRILKYSKTCPDVHSVRCHLDRFYCTVQGGSENGEGCPQVVDELLANVTPISQKIDVFNHKTDFQF